MKRFSVPTDNMLFQEFERRVPRGIRATLIRGLVRIALNIPEKTMWDIASNEDKPGMFEIREKES